MSPCFHSIYPNDMTITSEQFNSMEQNLDENHQSKPIADLAKEALPVFSESFNGVSQKTVPDACYVKFCYLTGL